MNQAEVIDIGEFDRILNGKNMFGPAVVDVVHQGGQGGGFPRASGAGHKNQAPWFAAGVHHHGRQGQLFRGRNMVAEGAQASGIGASLPVGINAETGDSLQSIGTVQFPGLLELFALGVVDQRKN